MKAALNSLLALALLEGLQARAVERPCSSTAIAWMAPTSQRKAPEAWRALVRPRVRPRPPPLWGPEGVVPRWVEVKIWARSESKKSTNVIVIDHMTFDLITHT